MTDHGHLLQDDSSPFARGLLGVKVIFARDAYDASLDSIEEANLFLRRTIVQNITLEPSRNNRRSKKIVTQIQMFRDRATSVYHDVIKGPCWQCLCKDKHVAALRLETRSYESSQFTTHFRIRFILAVHAVQGVEMVCSEGREVEIMSNELNCLPQTGGSVDEDR